jgi:GNAT superfamily N-acetyltransferase
VHRTKALTSTERSAYLSALRQREPKTGAGASVSIGVEFFGAPAGVVVAEADAATGRGTIHALRVHPELRRRGIGRTLMEEAQQELRRIGSRSLEVLYVVQDNDGAGDFLTRCGWPQPHWFAMICRTDYALLSKAPWMSPRPLPAPLEVFRWRDLDLSEKVGILASQQDSPWYPETLSPFSVEDYDPTVSLGLRHRGEVAGWCISHAIAGTALRCAKLYVRRDLQRTGRAIALLSAAFHRSPEAGFNRFVFDVVFDNRRMVDFVNRRMTPFVHSRSFVKRSVRQWDQEAARAELN